MKRVVLRPLKRSQIRYAHPWIFRSQIDKVEEDLADGEIAHVFSAKNNLIGVGYFNSRSEITVRLLTHQDEPIDARFFEKRIAQALEFRKRHVKDANAYRVVFSESDGLPGLIVDNYNGTCVIQILTFGMERQTDLVVQSLKKIFSPTAIYKRNDAAIRSQEGLALEKGFIGPAGKTLVEIEENHLRYHVDIENGHKTGFYLDQRENRRIFSGLARGKKILDCFTYTGAFALTAAKTTGGKVTAIDSSEEMGKQFRENAKLNRLEKQCHFKAANVFDELKKFDQAGEKFDVVVLDPPSFTRGRKGIESATSGYKEINLRAMKILNPGGLLVTATCSYHMTTDLFYGMLLEAAHDARKTLRLLHPGLQALDHPVELTIPESFYLKCFFLEVNPL